jgi:hypothetical protein
MMCAAVMKRLQSVINELSARADDRDLIALLTTTREARLYNADLARELRYVVESLKEELERKRSAGLRLGPFEQ